MANPQPTEEETPPPRTFWSVCWEYKWWWLSPVLLVAVFYLFLLLSTDMIGDSPFQYILR